MSLKENRFTYFEELDKKGQILAKANGTTLQEHSSCIVQITTQIVDNLYLHKSLKDFDDLIKELIKLIAYIHDAGKADKRWQQDIIKDGKGKSKILHPLFSLPVAKEYLERYLRIEIMR
jgi:CRISPR/Cas system-associated endonuclease Cas3-HD